LILSLIFEAVLGSYLHIR